MVNKIEPESRKIQESTSVPTVSPMPPTTGVKSAGNPKLRKPTKEESLLRIDEGFRSGLSLRGFSEHEIEIVIGYLRSEILHPDRNEKSALEKAGAELSLDTDKARQLSEVFNEVLLHGTVFSFEDVKQCLSSRLKGISNCTKGVLDEFLEGVKSSMKTDEFVLNAEIVDLSIKSEEKMIKKCSESPARAEYQFRLVFVECEAI